MKMYFEDLEEGTVFPGEECIADKNEMLDYARKNDPSPLHVDEEAARNSPHGGLIASAGIRSLYGIGQPFRSSLQSRFLVGSNGISSCLYLCVQATDYIPRSKFGARSRRANRAGIRYDLAENS